MPNFLENNALHDTQPILTIRLRELRYRGFHPRSLIDVGAHKGEFSLICADVWPEMGRIHAIDANLATMDELTASLKRIADAQEKMVICSHEVLVLDGDYPDPCPFYSMSSGSSVYWEKTSVHREKVHVQAKTLDTIVLDGIVPPPLGPILLKLDTQGSELLVMKGATKVLKDVEVIICECSTIEYDEGAPLFANVIAYMAQTGFLVYDFAGNYRTTENAMFQTDVIFVREDSELRKKHDFKGILEISEDERKAIVQQ